MPKKIDLPSTTTVEGSRYPPPRSVTRRRFLMQAGSAAGAWVSAVPARKVAAEQRTSQIRSSAVQTALGPIAASRLGYTLGMDHLTWGTLNRGLSWQRRAECIAALVDAGFADRLLLSNDWMLGASVLSTGVLQDMERQNPDGLLFSVRKVVPRLKALGVAERDLHTLTIENPRRFFGRLA